MNVTKPVGENGGWMRIKEAAKFIRMSDKTVRRMIDSGQLASSKPRGIRLIWRDDLERLLKNSTQGGA